jgi:hypothetical protein
MTTSRAEDEHLTGEDQHLTSEDEHLAGPASRPRAARRCGSASFRGTVAAMVE